MSKRMRIKSRSLRATIGSGATLVTGALWKAYSIYTTASDLPRDAGSLARMVADPPVYLPWLIVLAGMVVLVWSLWPDQEALSNTSEQAISNTSQGPNSPAIASIIAENVHFGSPPSP